MKTAVIIGAGPAGLTAAFELLTRTDIIPVIIEVDKQVGGLSKTVNYHGNKIDIGGHRFFSKSEKVIAWWLQFLALEPAFEGDRFTINYHNQAASIQSNQSAEPDEQNVMLVRRRKSRIFYHKQLFDYPLSLSIGTLQKLGFGKTFKAFLSYLYSKIFPKKPENTLEDFFINRFGEELYKTFFRDYTRKVWGVPCKEIPASWGQQRVKNLDIGKLIGHAISSIFKRNTRLDQKGTSTSLIEQFLYPKFGPGQMWETVVSEIKKRGGRILMETAVSGIRGDGGCRILSVETTDLQSGQKTEVSADYFFSSMPVKELVAGFSNLMVPANVKKIALSLEYRDFLIVGILTDRLLLREKDGSDITDNWIYIQDKNLQAGRLQFFQNWSPWMVAHSGFKWIGVEYFSNETDAFWQQPDNQLAALAVREMESIGILNAERVKDTVVVRVKKAYPSYYGAYKDFHQVQDFLDQVENLFPVGRNGMHRYNNSDHSMLTAMASVDHIISGKSDKKDIWAINTEEEYHEEQINQ